MQRKKRTMLFLSILFALLMTTNVHLCSACECECDLEKFILFGDPVWFYPNHWRFDEWQGYNRYESRADDEEIMVGTYETNLFQFGYHPTRKGCYSQGFYLYPVPGSILATFDGPWYETTLNECQEIEGETPVCDQ